MSDERPGPSTAGSDAPAAEWDVVVLVDADGTPIGTAPRDTVHTRDTPLHLAFSSYLFDADGRMLLTRRALTKRTWPGVWTNACCGHRRPGEDAIAAATRRIREELGTAPTSVRIVLPDYRYRAVDASGIVEHELCPVLIGRIDADALRPHPDEVAEIAWVDPDAAIRATRATPFAFSPWSVEQIGLLARDGAFEPDPITPGAASPGSQSSETPPPAAEGTAPDATERFVAAVERRLDAEIDRLDAEWSRLGAGLPLDVLPVDLPEWLRRRLRGGKRFRARMVVLGFTAIAPASSWPHALVDAAAALEFLHAFGLLHDDVMDESAFRRGGPAAQIEAAQWHEADGDAGAPARFGDNLAILLGDLAHTIADRITADLPAEVRSVWHELSIELIAGQRADLTGAAARRRDLANAELVSRLKSARYTIERPIELGARIAGATAAQRAALAQWGRHTGRAFALRDDVLGVWGDPAETGKPVGDDLREAKPTAILALGAERLDGRARTILDHLGTGQTDEHDLVALADALADVGVRDEVEARIRACVDAADAALEGGSLAEPGAAQLREAVRSIAWRAA